MHVDLSKRIAMVTGGSNGIGRPISVLLAQCGARGLACKLSIRQENYQLFQNLGIVQSVCDVRSTDAIQSWFDSVIEQASGGDILVNNAAIMVTGTAIAIDGGKSLGLPPKSDQ